MMSVWSHRPRALYLGLFIAAYVLACGFAQSLAIVPGTGISIWPPGGLFIATLILAPRRSWPWWILGGCLAELLSNAIWFYSPLPAAFLIYVGNALEAVVAAWLINRVLKRPAQLETLQEVLAFVVLGAGIAPVVSATVGSATLAWFGIQSQSFVTAWPLWWIGDATGVLIVAPLALAVFHNWRGKTRLSAAQWVEAGVLGLIFLGVAALSLSGYLPFAYIIMPPLLWAAVRFEFKGAAISLALLALITAIFTMTGAGEFVADPESQKHKQIMLQLFLAISAFSALIVAGISRQHQLAVLTLRQSVETLREREQELSQLVDMVPSHVWRLTPKGEPTFFNRRMVDFLGFDVADSDRPGMSQLEAAIHPDDAAGFTQALNHCLATGENFAMRYRLRRADGVYHWMSSRAEPMRDQAGSIVQWYGLCHDIDDQVRAEEAVRLSERTLRQMIDAVPVRVWSVEPASGSVYFNKRYQDHFRAVIADFDARGEPRIEELLQQLIHPEDAPDVQRTLQNCFESGGGTAMRFRWREKDDVYRWAECRVEPRRDDDGRVVQWYGVSLDIDEEVRALEALRDRERELSQLVDMVPVHIARMAPDGKPTFFSKRTLQSIGVDDVAAWDTPDISRSAAIIGATVHPEDGPRMREVLAHALATGEPYTIRYRRRWADGEYRWMEGRAEPLRDQNGAIVQWYAAAIDIDDEVRAQQALRERERELSQLVDIVPSLLWRLNAEGEPTFFNKRLINFLGPDIADVGKPGMKRLSAIIEAAIHPDDAESLAGALRHSFATGERFSKQYRLRRADGVYRWVRGSAEPLRDESGQIIQWYGLTHDIDDQLRIEEELRERERSLWQIVETLPAMIDCAAPDGEPVYRNPQLRDFLGYKLEELDGTGKTRLDGTLDAGVHPDDVAGVKDNYAHSLRTGEPYARRHRLRRFDGEYRWVETRAAPMRNAEGVIVQWNVICLDIDAEVRAEDDLRQAREGLARASQVASLAELSASIAHEVNQPLAAVVANSHACQRWLMAEPPNMERAQRTVERIIRDANSAADVVSRIRALFKQSADRRVHTTLSGVIDEARNLMADEAARRRARMDVDVDGNLPFIAIDRIQIQQVLINLVRNGIEAMETVSGDRVIKMRVRHIGNAVQTEISDRGQGIEFPEKMFEPFFTTKENGMGMGLAICRSIVELHGGRLWAEKNNPHGATLIFTLPIETKAVS
ncbi:MULTISPECIES: PAS domain-containing protein [unclassified Rhizobium]|uniref:PAS domain-containing protein n=1 Tax=unclassified Rhizobium TaxID=2613769 RepID=UPI0007EA6F5E|nr:MULTISPECIES: PAS domain-containing protein [unclassified Rhizobium]ANM14618.1 multi-sensor signal transduction multi-kinase nodulation NodV-like protein [Rhizobium sp. N324]ANM21007.1 multi-sensor signal transduction multi-kinase nodulation NodV-like protein [Rhizobium sp. N541]ANM27380.1 multi-sensor signal transduction multi-kinase nodulation NodV-like protein [Rhizobium sp. N941]OYC99723.1 multi-sensor signal transduction multi-kinase nodulation NodV-like protein [Rhizobium sp. N4311]